MKEKLKDFIVTINDKYFDGEPRNTAIVNITSRHGFVNLSKLTEVISSLLLDGEEEKNHVSENMKLNVEQFKKVKIILSIYKCMSTDIWVLYFKNIESKEDIYKILIKDISI